jgi:ABC-type multidrug transport system permease subunit
MAFLMSPDNFWIYVVGGSFFAIGLFFLVLLIRNFFKPDSFIYSGSNKVYKSSDQFGYFSISVCYAIVCLLLMATPLFFYFEGRPF